MDIKVNNATANRPRKKSFHKKLLVSILALLLIGLAIFGSGILPLSDKPNPDRFQVVVLSSGQTYFGKLTDTSGEYLTLENVYYTRADELPANATEDQKTATGNNSTLVKMGSEVYGPESTLKIRSEQVLFWQNLTEDSKVAKAIAAAE